MLHAHHEENLETYITKKLTDQGWLEGSPKEYDQQRALYPEDIFEWIKETQPKTWEKLVALNGSSTKNVILDRLDKSLNLKIGGTINILRKGFNIAGAGNISMSQIAPEDERNEEVIKKYKANRLRVVRQLKYCPTREWEIDLVFFINGIPVATIELKTDFTQSIEDAMKQYKEDRLPIDPKTKRKEPLLTFKRGAIVHFAMSDSDIRMTTHLKGDNTFFLPFNKGDNGHKGNAKRDDGEYPVAYFWEDILKPDAWLRIFHSFVYVETKLKEDVNGKPKKDETLIFPRYHQWEAVNTMVDDAKDNGPGMQYLCEHSAGSGKTSTIAWISHDLIRLRKDNGKAYFDTVIIVTDRNVLDAQLQEAVQQIDHQFGVISAIDKKKTSLSKSKQLTKALLAGTPIIIVTIQTFPYAMESILVEKSLRDKKFAVIIDEAHTSQTGSTAQGLRATLGMSAKEEMDKMTVEELLIEIQSSRVRPTNVSHFAFTATPKHSTLTLFGRPENKSEPISKENPPVSFHKYSMRQAIEEGFILDVLENYTPYETAFQLNKKLKENKRVDAKYAKRALGKWMSLHPTNVTQKVEFIIEHFRANVAHLLNGEAKAMVVTSGRAQAVKYKLAFDKFIKGHGYNNVNTLVAFTGKIKGSEIQDGVIEINDYDEFTEKNMNSEIGSTDLRNAFDTSEYSVMIVANKFQTGFNQPKLVAMYLDKKISGVDAVQTLSRLNRIHPGKDKTFVIDFVNEPKTIRDAFRTYDDGAELEDIQDLNVVYEMKEELDGEGIYNIQDLENFKKAKDKAFKNGESSPEAHRLLYAATQTPTEIFNKNLEKFKNEAEKYEKMYQQAHNLGDKKGMEGAEFQRSESTKKRESLMMFKTRLGRFSRIYNYVSQLIDFGDPELENFAAFTGLLSKRLDGITPDRIDLSGLVLTGYAIKRIEDSDKKGESEALKPIESGDKDPHDREKAYLSEIVKRLNNIFGDIAPSDDQKFFTAQIINKTEQDAIIVDQVKNNPKSQALRGDLPRKVDQAVVEAMRSNQEMSKVLLKDKQTMEAFYDLIYDLMHKDNSNTLLYNK